MCCTQAPGLPHAGRAGHVRPKPYQRPRYIHLAQLVRHNPCFGVAVVSSASARAQPPKQHTKPAAASQSAIDRAVALNASPWAPGRLSSWPCLALALRKDASFRLSEIRSLQPVLRCGCGSGRQLRLACAKPPAEEIRRKIFRVGLARAFLRRLGAYIIKEKLESLYQKK